MDVEGLTHECGLAALYQSPAGDPDQTPNLLRRMLLDLQNRGQLAAGFTSYRPGDDLLLRTFKAIGPVTEALRVNHPEEGGAILEHQAGPAAIGHIRYATCGPNSVEYAQPFERQHDCKWKWFAVAFNGQIANVKTLRAEIQSQGHYHLSREGDTAVLTHLITRELQGEEPPDLVDVFGRVCAQLDGAYNIVFLNAMGEMVILRDPQGFRPLCYATDGPLFAAASESVPLTNLGFREVANVAPGEMLIVKDGAYRRERYAEPRRASHCFFEYVYFANAASSLDGQSVYLSRSRLGRLLAEEEMRRGAVRDLHAGDVVVVPVPDTGKAAADAMAHALNLPSVEGLMRNRSVGRTFIEGRDRETRVRMKFTPLPEVLEGKRVLLVEDSIVRGTTLKTLLGFLRDRGRVKEVHLRVACPPIVAPCFYGIDMTTTAQLFAAGRDDFDRMARELGADSLLYLPLASLADGVGLPESRLCRACVNGDYPTPEGRRLYQLDLARPAGDGPRHGEFD